MKSIKIKMPSNVIYELNSDGNIIAKNIMRVLFKEPLITKKKDNVIESIDNCLYDGYAIRKAYYNMETNELRLETADRKWKVCPICKLGYDDYPAISRVDNKTEICPDCGMQEALKEWEENNGDN